jgi:hypothetical protein
MVLAPTGTIRDPSNTQADREVLDRLGNPAASDLESV